MNRHPTPGWWELPLLSIPVIGMAAIALATCITGCGGAPFVLEPQADSIAIPPAPSAPNTAAQGPEDSGAEADQGTGNEASPQDGGDEHEAESSAVEAATPDAGVEAGVDAALDALTLDAAPTLDVYKCTPFPLPLQQFGACTTSGFAEQPIYFNVRYTVLGAGVCQLVATPIQCTCIETYTCDCLLNNTTNQCTNPNNHTRSCDSPSIPNVDGGPGPGLEVLCSP